MGVRPRSPYCICNSRPTPGDRKAGSVGPSLDVLQPQGIHEQQGRAHQAVSGILLGWTTNAHPDQCRRDFQAWSVP